MTEYNYEKVAGAAVASMEGHMCWPVEWMQEDLPLETKDGMALDVVMETLVNRSNAPSKLLEHYIKPEKGQDALEMPRQDIKRESVLIFSDTIGWMKSIIEAAPDGRISTKKVVDNYYQLEQEDVARHLNQKNGWDLVIFACGIDPPQTNSVADVIEQNSIVSRLYFWLLQEIQKTDGGVKKICTITRGNFAEDTKTNQKAGLGLTVGGCLFGMGNTARMELESIPIQYIDVEYFPKENRQVFQKVASEIFRDCTFGHNNVRITNNGRYVLRQVKSTAYQAAQKEFPIPSSGIIAISGGNGALGLVMGNWILDKAEKYGVSGFEIQFLSRSCKISDLNAPLWQQIQARAARLGVPVEQLRMDMSSQEGVDSYFDKVSPRLVGFIHSAGVLQDSMLTNVTWEKFETVYDSKHRAALYVHSTLERYQNPNFNFYWVFSSTAVWGNMGQINYSGSNSFLDCLARHRLSKGKPCTAIQWGAWGDVGMAATMTDAMRLRMTQSPMPYFSNAEGLNGLELGLSTGLPYFSVFKFNPMIMIGMIQGDEHPNQCYGRNFTAEIVPTPNAKSLDRPHLYTAYRMGKGPYSELPDCDQIVYRTFVQPIVEANEKEWGEDFRRW